MQDAGLGAGFIPPRRQNRPEFTASFPPIRGDFDEFVATGGPPTGEVGARPATAWVSEGEKVYIRRGYRNQPAAPPGHSPAGLFCARKRHKTAYRKVGMLPVTLAGWTTSRARRITVVSNHEHPKFAAFRLRPPSCRIVYPEKRRLGLGQTLALSQFERLSTTPFLNVSKRRHAIAI